MTELPSRNLRQKKKHRADSAKEAPQVAEVVAVGPGTKDEPMELKVGDKVVFPKYGGTEVKYNGEEYTILHQSDILAIIE